MKFIAFHLMPYADLDLSYTDTYESAWVTLPNSYYDPVKGHALYNRYLDELEHADRLGFDGLGVNEHHQNAYGLMATPGVIAGALARRTKGTIAVLGRALPLVNNPLVIAEEFSILDNITGGRLIAGFVRGIGAEYHSWNMNLGVLARTRWRSFRRSDRARMDRHLAPFTGAGSTTIFRTWSTRGRVHTSSCTR